jgi:hypothetical protein
MLTQLSLDEPAEAVVEVEAPEPEPEPEEVADAAATTPTPMVSRDQTDTAMLLRELSSLGFEEDDDRPSTPPPAHRPVPHPSAEKKKRKGLFGRG